MTQQRKAEGPRIATRPASDGAVKKIVHEVDMTKYRVAVIFASIAVLSFLAPFGTAAAKPASHSSNPLVIGTAASPPMGPGPGRIFLVNPVGMGVRSGSFGKAGTPSGNSFFAAYGRSGAVYVPTLAGKMIVLNAESLKETTAFPVISAARLARVVPRHNLVLVLSAKGIAAYGLKTRRPAFSLPIGGNAIAVNAAETRAFIGGNMDTHITEITLPQGRVIGTKRIAHSGDLLIARGKLFSANMKSGILSILDLKSGNITKIRTKEVDPAFSYDHIPAANAGFMQLAASSSGRIVYAAGFSGHILKFSTVHDKYLGEISVIAAKHGPNKLSGLAIVDHGREALVTIENRHEAALVALGTGKIVHVFPGVTSNRWVVSQRP